MDISPKPADHEKNTSKDLIPNLHDHMSLECLMRLPYDQFLDAAEVSKGWEFELQRPDFHRQRRARGVTQPVLVVVYSQKFRMLGYEDPPPINSLALFNHRTGRWSELPPVPEFRFGLPLDCRLAGVGSELVMIGGWDPRSYEVFNSVYIYNFISGEWRRGADMPGDKRCHFGCASDHERFVYVASGSDRFSYSKCSEKPSNTVLAYDVSSDEWTRLPDTRKARYDGICDVIFCKGKLHMIQDDKDSRRIDVEVLDLETKRWDVGTPSEDAMGHGKYACDGDGRMFKCSNTGKNVLVREGSTWRVLTDLPPMMWVNFATMWQNKLLVIGSIEYTDYVEIYALDLENCSWENLEPIDRFINYVQEVESGCVVEI